MKAHIGIGLKRRLFLAVLGAAMLLLVAPRAQGYVYWANWDGNAGATIGRATIDGAQVNQSFITGAHGPCGVAVGGGHIYWGNQTTDTIGRANLDGSGVKQDFITGITGFGRPCSVAVDAGHIYWDESITNIGRANLDGTDIKRDFITGDSSTCGVSVDAQHVYWGNANSSANSIGRANLDGNGVNQSFIPNAVQGSGLHEPCNPVADASHVYFAAGENTRIQRANLDGTGVQQGLIDGAHDATLALDSRYLFWTGDSPSEIGRANLDGTGVTHTLIPGATIPSGIAVDSNTFSLGNVKRKKNGTATLFADVPGPGQVGLRGKGLKALAISSAARESGTTAGGTVKLKIKPGKGKKGSALRHRLQNAGKAKVGVTVTYVPSGGDANSLTKKVKLIER
jgi:hypothetical protein